MGLTEHKLLTSSGLIYFKKFDFQVVEQTEFYDDASFQPFRASGKSEPYVKRCTAVKLLSAEKLKYICKDQLGLEAEFEQKALNDGKFVVDGFLLTFDVSLVPNRYIKGSLKSQVVYTKTFFSHSEIPSD